MALSTLFTDNRVSNSLGCNKFTMWSKRRKENTGSSVCAICSIESDVPLSCRHDTREGIWAKDCQRSHTSKRTKQIFLSLAFFDVGAKYRLSLAWILQNVQYSTSAALQTSPPITGRLTNGNMCRDLICVCAENCFLIREVKTVCYRRVR